MSTLTIIIIVVAVFLLVTINILAYNSLVRARNKAKEAFSSIDVHLKLRYDLIPNLVEVVKGHTKHEAEIMNQVAVVRANAKAAKSENEKIEAANAAGRVIGQLFATGEDYPELKSDKLFRRLSHEMVEIEDKISAARRFYNSQVNKYNNLVMQFPMSIFAKLFGFKKKNTFEIDSIERNNITL